MAISQSLYCLTLTLNGLKHTHALLTALAELPFATRVIVIDQGSTDGTRDWLKQSAGDGLIYVPCEQNIGVAAGWNLGIRIALANGAQAVLIAGNDTVPMPGAIARLGEHLRAGVPFITGTAVEYDAPIQDCPPLTPEDKLLAAPDFSFFVITAPTIEALARHEAKNGANISPWDLGLFDSRFMPAYFEDNDFHHRLHQAGLLAARDPLALFRHDCSLTIRTNPEIAAQNQETFKRNADGFKQKWGGLPHELDDPPQARPLNVTDEQWTAMSGGREVEEVDRAAAAAAARAVYGQYGIG